MPSYTIVRNGQGAEVDATGSALQTIYSPRPFRQQPAQCASSSIRADEMDMHMDIHTDMQMYYDALAQNPESHKTVAGGR